MTPYLDAGFLLTVLVPTHGTAVANEMLRRAGAPFGLNSLHQLQAENLLRSMEKSSQTPRRRAGQEARRLWHNYLAEGVFQFVLADWDTGFRAAILLNERHSGAPPPPLLVLHPALAAVAGARQFFSFEPRSRAVARAVGLAVLPARL